MTEGTPHNPDTDPIIPFEDQARAIVVGEAAFQAAQTSSSIPGATVESVHNARERSIARTERLIDTEVDQGHGYKAQTHGKYADHWADILKNPNLSEKERADAENNMEWQREKAGEFAQLASGEDIVHTGGMTSEEIELAKADLARLTRKY